MAFADLLGKTSLETGENLLKGLFSAQEHESTKRKEQTAELIAEQMAGRGILDSGIHMRALEEAMSALTAEEEAARNKMVLDVYSALDKTTQQQLNRDFQEKMAKQQMIFQQSLANQQKRGNILSGILGLGAAAIGAGKLF